MNKFKLASYILIGIVVLISLILIVVASLKPKVAGMYIESTPEADVWVNGKVVGQTPYRSTTKPGETIIKLVPSSYGTTLMPYETKVRLTSGVETVIRYDFGKNDETSAGEVISFEKIEGGETSLIAVTIPDSAELLIDGGARAFTPHKTTSIVPGEHVLRFNTPGYQEREVRVKTFENYKLTAIVKLARVGEQVLAVSVTPTPSPLPSTIQQNEQVEILGTDVGFLRVRSEPNSQSDEIGRVEPGKRYTLIETDTQSGWYKIEYQEGQTGWISNQFARPINTKPSPTTTPNVGTPSATIRPLLTPTP